jgi:hypothetical protein
MPINGDVKMLLLLVLALSKTRIQSYKQYVAVYTNYAYQRLGWKQCRRKRLWCVISRLLRETCIRTGRATSASTLHLIAALPAWRLQQLTCCPRSNPDPYQHAISFLGYSYTLYVIYVYIILYDKGIYMTRVRRARTRYCRETLMIMLQTSKYRRLSCTIKC